MVPAVMFLVNKTVVMLLPVKIFLHVIRWSNNTVYIVCFFKCFHGPVVLSYELWLIQAAEQPQNSC